MRPAYLTPKLTEANRVEIRRLRAENPRQWTLQSLAARFRVNRSTIARALQRRVRVSVEQELTSLRAAVEDNGPIPTRELLKLKTQEWSRQLLAERDLGRQQQLVSLIKSATPMLAEPEREQRFGDTTSEMLARRAAEARALEAAFKEHMEAKAAAESAQAVESGAV